MRLCFLVKVFILLTSEPIETLPVDFVKCNFYVAKFGCVALDSVYLPSQPRPLLATPFLRPRTQMLYLSLIISKCSLFLYD